MKPGVLFVAELYVSGCPLSSLVLMGSRANVGGAQAPGGVVVTQR